MKLLRKSLIVAGLLALCAGSSLAQSTGDPVREAQRLTRVAQVAQQQGRFDDAIKAYQTITVVAASSPRIAAAAHLAGGNVYMVTGKFQEAATAYRKSVALDPSSAEALNNLGEALGELKQYRSALESFQ